MSFSNLKIKWSIVAGIVSLTIATLSFQNCSQQGFEIAEMASTSEESTPDQTEPPLIHPTEEKSSVANSKKYRIHNRTYIYELMKDIAESTKRPWNTGLLNQLDSLILGRAPQFGGNCNYYGAHSGRDCGGNFGHANLPQNVESSTLSETYRLQICEFIFGFNDNVLNALDRVLVTDQKISLNRELALQIFDLFYRGKDIDENVIQVMLQMDQQLKETAPNDDLNRWRLNFMLVCESPGWVAI